MTVDARVLEISSRNAGYASALKIIRQREGWTGVKIGGSREKGSRLGFFETSLPDGTTGFWMRRPDDCLQAAISSCAQVPMHLVPDLRIDTRLAQGVDPEQLTRESWQALARWATRLGIVVKLHAVPPKHARRWIGITNGDGGYGGDHCLLMSRSDVLFDPWLAPVVEPACLEHKAPSWGITLER